MTLVVDASVAVKWFIVEPGDREALALIDGGEALLAPELVVAEVVNVVWKRLVRGSIDLSQAADVPRELPKLFAQLVPLAPLAGRTLEIAEELRHPLTTASTSRSRRRRTQRSSRPIGGSQGGSTVRAGVLSDRRCGADEVQCHRGVRRARA